MPVAIDPSATLRIFALSTLRFREFGSSMSLQTHEGPSLRRTPHVFGAPGTIRTSDPQTRSVALRLRKPPVITTMLHPCCV
jgi:hypothetical protein